MKPKQKPQYSWPSMSMDAEPVDTEGQLYYAFLYKGLEHLQILVWGREFLESIPYAYWGMSVYLTVVYLSIVCYTMLKNREIIVAFIYVIVSNNMIFDVCIKYSEHSNNFKNTLEKYFSCNFWGDQEDSTRIICKI